MQEISARFAEGLEIVWGNLQQQVGTQTAKDLKASLDHPGFGALNIHLDEVYTVELLLPDELVQRFRLNLKCPC